MERKKDRILEVPTKVFNAGLDKWIKLSMGIKVKDIYDCSYCDKFCICLNCPLTDLWGDNMFESSSRICCNKLFFQFKEVYLRYGLIEKAKKIADKIVVFYC